MMRKMDNRYPVAKGFELEERKYKCSLCHDTGKILEEVHSEAAAKLYGPDNDGMIIQEVPCPKCDAETARKLFKVTPKAPDPDYHYEGSLGDVK